MLVIDSCIAETALQNGVVKRDRKVIQRWRFNRRVVVQRVFKLDEVPDNFGEASARNSGSKLARPILFGFKKPAQVAAFASERRRP